MNVHADFTQLSGIVVAVAPAPAANRSGKIKLQSGEILYAFPEKLKTVQIGGRYEFDVDPYTKEGKQYLNVKNLRDLAPIKDNPNFVGTAEVLAQRRPTAQAERPINGADFNPPGVKRQAPAQPAQHGAAFPVEWNRPTHPRDGRRMFLTATLGHYIDTGRVDLKAQSIADAMVEILQAYDNVVGCDDPN